MKFIAWAGLAFWPMIAFSSDKTPDASPAQPAAPISPDELKFFESKIRPVLVEQCYGCHSQGAVKANKLKGGLLVDSRDGLRRGGDSGPAIDVEHLDKSLLLDAIRYESLQMPPQGKLSANVIADFEQWVTSGAPDPRTESAGNLKKGIDLEAGRQHWAYRPVQSAAIPAVSPEFKARSPIDALILSKLPAKSLEPAPEADRTTLIRRVYFDLVGLPPEPSDIEEFVADDSPDAYEQLVDRLIASPHFGERWGRRWLSVARYGESLTLRGMILPEAWRYRDYVIDYFNSDRPFQQFIIEQLAGDLLPANSLEERQRQLIATTYLVIGNSNLEEQDKKQLRMDVVDEQLDAISKGFLAQTLTCARCHDHKFDPISTLDYYALAGFLANVESLDHANVSKWIEFPLPVEPKLEAIYSKHETMLASLRDNLKLAKDREEAVLRSTGAKVVNTNGIVAIKDLPGIIVDDQQAKLVGEWQHSQVVKPYVGNGYIHDQNSAKGQKTVTLIPEMVKAGRYDVRLAYTSGDNRSDKVPVTVFSADGEKTVNVNQKLQPPIDGHFVSLGQYGFEPNGQGFVIVSNEGTSGSVIVDAVQFLPVEQIELNRPKADDQPVSALLPANALESKAIEKELNQLQKSGPHRPMFMSVREGKQFDELKIHIRGSVHQQGDVAPRGFLKVVERGSNFEAPKNQSGRRELGEWIASSDNPLTGRVLANRVWYWLFGAGLSRTPDNFGTTGDPPSHPELLDELTRQLLDHDWSLKKLVREIVLSRAYRQSSVVAAAQKLADPENVWLSHQNRRRLDPECLLDAILSVNGKLQTDMGGNTIRPGTSEDYNYRHQLSCRAVYWPVLRNSLPEIFEAFDFADPSVPTGVRNTSTVAPQALFTLNNEWLAGEAAVAARRILTEPLPDDQARIQRAFVMSVGRPPTATEARLARESLSRQTPERAWTNLFRALFATIDFRYVE